MLVIPASHQFERGIFLSALLFSYVYYVSQFGWKLDKRIFFVGLSSVVVSVFYIALGVYFNAPGAIAVSTVYLIWPILYLFFIGVFSDMEYYRDLPKVIIVGTFLVTAILIGLVLETAGLTSIPFSGFLGKDTCSVAIYDGGFMVSTLNVSTFIFAIPFLMTHVLLPAELSSLSRGWRKFTWLVLVLSIGMMAFTGRRALYLDILATPIFIFVFVMLSRLRKEFNFKKFIILLLFLFIIPLSLVVLFGSSISDRVNDFLLAFDSDMVNRGFADRNEQAHALMNGLLQSPVFGHGHGSFSAASIRDIDQPWAYELSYLALLYQVGLFGFAVYSFCILWLFYMLVRMLRKRVVQPSEILPWLVATSAFLAANATNPYLAKFDYLWVIFMPVAILNSLLIKHKDECNAIHAE
jgi:hypothetical protein